MKGGKFVKEYSILIRNWGASPYILGTYSDILKAKNAIDNIVSLEEKGLRPYYVDNNFFNNKHILVGTLKYMCIQERDVTEWRKYSEIKNNKNADNKIIYFNFIK